MSTRMDVRDRFESRGNVYKTFARLKIVLGPF